MGKAKLPWWIGPLFSLGIGLLTWLAAPYLPQELTAAGLVFGVACILLSVVGTLWHFRSVLGRPATAVLMLLSAAFAAYASVFFWQKANAVPPRRQASIANAPSPATQKPPLLPLRYQICGVYLEHANKLASLELEIDPINPNHQEVSDHIKRWNVDFGGRRGTVDVEQSDMVLVPQEQIIPGVTRQPAMRVHVIFDPPIRAPRMLKGTYNFELRYGWDEDNTTTPAQFSGAITGTFDLDGLPISAPSFSPTGGKNVNFDPGQCKVDIKWPAQKNASTGS